MARAVQILTYRLNAGKPRIALLRCRRIYPTTPTFQDFIIPSAGTLQPPAIDPILQNKANLREHGLALTAVHKESYKRKMRSMPLRKQSQFPCHARGVPVRVFVETQYLAPPRRQCGQERLRAKQSQFPEAGIWLNLRHGKEL